MQKVYKESDYGRVSQWDQPFQPQPVSVDLVELPSRTVFHRFWLKRGRDWG